MTKPKDALDHFKASITPLFDIIAKYYGRHPVAIWVVVVATLVMLTFELFSYMHFYFPVLDLGLFNRHMYGLIRLDFGPNPLKGFNLLGDHAHFILFLLAPIYAIFQTPVTLLVVQVLAISLSGWPIYLIAQKYFPRPIASLWLIPYFAYFGFWTALSYPFHVAALCVLPLAWSLYFLLDRRYVPLTIMLVLLVLTKEDMPPVACMIALYLIVIQRKFRLGAIIFAVSTAYFFFVTQLWLPLIAKSRYFFADLGLPHGWRTPPGELLHIFTTPTEKIKTMLYMLSSFGLGLPLLGLEILILLSPIWTSRFLSGQSRFWTIWQHYSANQGPILAVAAIIGTARLIFILRQAYRVRQRHLLIVQTAVPLFCLLLSALVYHKITFNDYGRLVKPSFYQLSTTDRTAWRAVHSIPHSASVGVQSAFAPATTRHEVYNLPLDLVHNQPDYLLLSTQYDAWPFSGNGVLEFINQAKSLGYHTEIAENGIYLLKR